MDTLDDKTTKIVEKMIDDKLKEFAVLNTDFKSWISQDSVTDQYSPITGASQQIGFFGTSKIAKPTVTGSRGGNAALASLLTKLAALGLITDSSS